MSLLLKKVKRKVERLMGREADWREEVPGAILRRFPEGGTLSVIDVGANEGNFTRALLNYYQIRRAILAEPLPQLAKKLREEFTAPTFTVVDCAVSDREGTVEFEMNEAAETSSMLKMDREHYSLAQTPRGLQEKIVVRTRTLDDIVKEAGWDGVDLLKIDVQGVEDKVLAGAAETLPRTRGIWVEVSWKPLYEGSAIYSDIYETLDSRFRLLDIQPAFRAPDGEMLQSDMFFLRR